MSLRISSPQNLRLVNGSLRFSVVIYQGGCGRRPATPQSEDWGGSIKPLVDKSLFISVNMN